MGFWSGVAKGIPIVGSVVSAGIEYLQGKGGNDAEKQARELHNAWVTGRKDVAEKIIADLQAQGFDPYGPQVTTQSQDQSSTSGSTSRTTQNQATNENYSSRPDITAQYQPLEELNRLRLQEAQGKGLYSDTEQIKQDQLAKAALAAQSLRTVQRTLADNAARRGLSAAQTAGALSAPLSQHALTLAQIMGETGKLTHDRQVETSGRVLNAINTLGKGEVGQRSGTSTGTTVGNTSGWGSSAGTSRTTAPPNMTALWNMLQPAEPANTNTGYNPLLQAGGDLVGSLLTQYANRKPKVPAWQTGLDYVKTGDYVS